jgi:hypothetical protein
MHRLDFAREQHLQAARAAFHIDDLDLESFLLVKTAGFPHPDGKDGYDRRRDADLERDRVGGWRLRRRTQQEAESRDVKAG